MPQKRKRTLTRSELLKKSKEDLLKIASSLGSKLKENLTKPQIIRIIQSATANVNKAGRSAAAGVGKTRDVARKQIQKTKGIAEKIGRVRRGIEKSVETLKKRVAIKETVSKKEPVAKIVLERVSEKPVHGTGEVEPSKFDMGDMSTRRFVEEALGTLPESYDVDTIYAIPRDPEWIFCYWDISRETIRHYLTQSIDNRLYIKISDVTNIIYDGENANRYLLYEIPPNTRNWYAFVDAPEKDFVVEIVVKSRERFLPILRSKAIHMPPASTSTGEVKFVTIPFDLPLARIKEILGPRLKDISELAYLLSNLQREGSELPFPYISPLPEGAVLIDELWGPKGEGIRRYLKGSEEIITRLRRFLKWNPSSENLIKER